MRLRDVVQEVRELGLAGTLFRVRWEARNRLPISGSEVQLQKRVPPSVDAGWLERLPFGSPAAVASCVGPVIPPASLAHLRETAEAATRGVVLCFGRWSADFGHPIRWHVNPLTGRGWPKLAPWRVALADKAPGDIKDAWEVGRFPHAYHLARAAAFFPAESDRYAEAFAADVRDFVASNPPGRGVHWASGQEIGFRLLAWLFACRAFLRTPAGLAVSPLIADALWLGAAYVDRHLDYARFAIRNNHLISEALLLFGAGILRADAPEAALWRSKGRRILDEEAERQFYPDGAYIQQSHNYHRVAIQDYLWACLFARAAGETPSDAWLAALCRSLDFLLAQQNPVDGRLPNFGANDGALPSPLSTCDFSDMRPTLQAVSLLVRNERAYPSGPWDEETAWWMGAGVLDAPLRSAPQRSRSFTPTGYHVLRGNDARSFATFRCGTLRDRYSQIDMLHLDVWWRGLNVLADPGSYRYNAAPEWHNHFMRTASHNTLVLDGRDQMVHHRPFKVLYWTRAHLLRFVDGEHVAVCEGEHDGYRRYAGRCVHRRTVLYLKDDLWVVVDRVRGMGRHTARLHWFSGEFSWRPLPQSNGLELQTPEGPFHIAVYRPEGTPVGGDVRTGAGDPPRGWLSRYYGEKVAAPSLALVQEGDVPLTFVSVLSAGQADVEVANGVWHVALGTRRLQFDVTSNTVEATMQ